MRAIIARGLALGLGVGIAAYALAGERAPSLRPLLGRSESTIVADGETLLDVAYRHRLGYQAVEHLNPNPGGVDNSAPPPRRAYAPVTPGSSAIVRIAWPPRAFRDIPQPMRMKGARARP